MLVRVMNWVSRHILLAPFMCLFLLFACGSSHKAIKSNTEVISKDSASESINIVHGSSTSLSELITTNSNYVIDFRIYDTRKPPDSLTGKPPLLADGHVEGDFSKNKRKEKAEGIFDICLDTHSYGLSRQQVVLKLCGSKPT